MEAIGSAALRMRASVLPCCAQLINGSAWTGECEIFARSRAQGRSGDFTKGAGLSEENANAVLHSIDAIYEEKITWVCQTKDRSVGNMAGRNVGT